MVLNQQTIIYFYGNRNANHHLTLKIFYFSKTEIQDKYKEMKNLNFNYGLTINECTEKKTVIHSCLVTRMQDKIVT
jgi:hypothetical protein